jgi:secretion/DNA translocation related TadE-like protein
VRTVTWTGQRERGAAVAWSLALMSLVLLVGLVTMALASVMVARQHAAAAADIAALAAAQALADPCGRAGASAAENGASLTACGQDAADMVVEVTVPAPAILNRLLALVGHDAAPVRASARAGPP